MNQWQISDSADHLVVKSLEIQTLNFSVCCKLLLREITNAPRAVLWSSGSGFSQLTAADKFRSKWWVSCCDRGVRRGTTWIVKQPFTMWELTNASAASAGRPLIWLPCNQGGSYYSRIDLHEEWDVSVRARLTYAPPACLMGKSRNGRGNWEGCTSGSPTIKAGVYIFDHWQGVIMTFLILEMDRGKKKTLILQK